MEDLKKLLAEVELFRGIDEKYLEKLIASTTIKRFPKGDIIIREGEKGNSLFILKQGEVSVTKKMTLFADDDTLNQVDKALIRLRDKDRAFFGEMAMCGKDDIRSATVMAQTDCELLEIQASALQDLAEKFPDFGAKFYRNLAAVLAERLRKANRDILKLTTALSIALEE